MAMKLQDVGPYARAALALFNANPGVKTFDTRLADPYVTATWLPKIVLAEGIITTENLRKTNKDYTGERNVFMNNCTPLLNTLGYKIQQCIDDGTITATYNSFGTAAFLRTIEKKTINAFHLAFDATMAKVNLAPVAAALNTVGFTAAMRTAITTNHDGAWGIQQNKINLKQEISDLSQTDQDIVNDCLKETAKPLKGMRAFAKDTGDKVLNGKATQRAVLRSVQPTVAKKPRVRFIKPASSVLLSASLPIKNIMQITLQTDALAMVCRQELKTSACTGGVPLILNKMVEVKKDDLPGSGEFIKVTNMSSTKKIKILYFEVDVVKV